jgi:6-phospho-3-hexuloisomerase
MAETLEDGKECTDLSTPVLATVLKTGRMGADIAQSSVVGRPAHGGDASARRPTRRSGGAAVTDSETVSAWRTVRDEVCGVLTAVSAEDMSAAAALFGDRGRRWFCGGQGRSGLVSQMAAMRLMHVGFDVHVLGEATAPSVGDGDGLLMVSGSGETPVSLHLARLALGFGAQLLVVTARADSTLAGLAEAVIEVPVVGTAQFGGTLFEQGALLLLDAVALDITAADPGTYAAMQRRHSNLQ